MGAESKSQRVHLATRGAERRVQLIINAVEAAVFTFLGVLYWVTPPSEFAESGINLTSVILVMCLGIVCVRWVTAYKGLIQKWHASAFTILDIGVLTLLLWSFHLQYGQPAPMVLKAPTFVFYFLFIVLRSLHYEMRYVIVAGLSSVVGWVALILYAYFSSPESLTHSYTSYLTSHQILLGAEIEKLLCVAFVTMVLVYAALRSQKALHTLIEEKGVVQDLSGYFSPELIKKIRHDADAIEIGKGEIKDISVLTLDIRGFTQLSSRLKPDEIIELITDYHRTAVPVIQREGGVIDKYTGDGILATFGALGPSGACAACCLKAMEDLVSVFQDWNNAREAASVPPVYVSMAATSGPVVVGAIGHETKKEFTVIGNAVNLAVKLEKHSRLIHAQAVTTSEMYELARRQGYPVRATPVFLKNQSVQGYSEPVDVVVIKHAHET